METGGTGRLALILFSRFHVNDLVHNLRFLPLRGLDILVYPLTSSWRSLALRVLVSRSDDEGDIGFFLPPESNSVAVISAQLKLEMSLIGIQTSLRDDSLK